MEDQLPQIRESYVSRCMNYLGEYGKQHSATHNCQQPIQRCLLILQNFINLFATEKTEKHGTAISRGNMIKLSIQVLSGPTIKIEMFDKETIGDLRVKIAKQIEFADPSALQIIRMFFYLKY